MLKEYFLNKIKEKHPENFSKYDYSLLPDEFKSKDKIPIGCLNHGIFKQVVNDHLKKTGCPKCYAYKRRTTLEEFIRKARLIHGDKYDYSKVIYVNSFIKVIIICKIHGNFLQTPSDHLSGYGCIECGFNIRKHTLEYFVTKASLIHNNFYTYTKTIYVNCRNKVIITCPIHGDFEQIPFRHLQGQGCHRCKESKGEKYISQVLDIFNISYIKEYRILPHRYFYDFYLPEYDIYIEYHGRQHYEPLKIFGGKKALLSCIKRDKIKIELIKRSSGILITIKYTFNTLEKIEDELLRLFSIIHPQFFNDKELTKQMVIDSNIYLIQDGISYKRKII